jgi:hypothetical protein
MFSSSLNQDPIEETPEQRMWKAVIARTLQEWVSGPLRSRREAEAYLFEDETDFRTVCYAAGMDPTALREKLRRLRKNGDGLAVHEAA